MVRLPKEQDAANIVHEVLGEEARAVRRFTTGSCHYVYEVNLAGSKQVVVRIASPDNLNLLAGGVYWSNLLRPLGLPLPALLFSDLTMSRFHFPFLILERLPGQDLNYVYPLLSPEDKRQIARSIVQIQNKVATLPLGQSYGFALSYETTPLDSWLEVLNSSLERSRKRILQVGLASVEIVNQVKYFLPQFTSYFAAIPPQPFLDDTTTKNVLIYENKLSGIVDVDFVCFGDSLFTVALTRASLLNSGYVTDYIDYWCEELNLAKEQYKILDFYTALFLVDFVSEFGQQFNTEKAIFPDYNRVRHLNNLIGQMLSNLA